MEPMEIRETDKVFFYRTPEGKRADADLHEAILADGDDAAAIAISRRVAEELGLTAEEIEALFGEG
jgi:hypothetical protein